MCLTSAFLIPTQTYFFNVRIETSHLYMWKKKSTVTVMFLYVFIAGSLQNSCRSVKTEEAKSSAGLLHLTARGVLLWSPRRRWYNLDYSQKVKPSGPDHFLIASLFIHRSPEVLPQGTSWTSNDFWPVRWVDTGLQVRGHTHTHT